MPWKSIEWEVYTIQPTHSFGEAIIYFKMESWCRKKRVEFLWQFTISLTVIRGIYLHSPHACKVPILQQSNIEISQFPNLT